MKTPLAWLNLLHERTRTSVAIAGVGFAVLLILMQLGFYAAVARTATRVYDQLEFDLLLVSPSYQHLAKAGTIPFERLVAAAAFDDVESAKPIYIGYSGWLNQYSEPRRRRGVLVMGVNPKDNVFRLAEINSLRPQLQRLDAVIMDRLSRPEFGPHHPGVQTDAGRRKVTVVGEFTLGTGFSADGAIIASDLTYSKLFPDRPLDAVNVGLVSLRKGADPDAVARTLRAKLPPDTLVFTRAEIESQERHHWVVKTSVGVIFGLGVIVAVIVGIAIVYQVLSSDIANRLPEYATLKAMGYGPRYLTGVILMQALTLAVAGFVPGFIVSWLLYRITEQQAHLPMDMTWPLAFGVLLLSMVMCSFSGWLSLRKVNAADPADLF